MLKVEIRTGKENMDIGTIYQFLSGESYWAKGISLAFVTSSMNNSYCVGAFHEGRQIGFGRVITDYYTFAWYADFFVLPEFHGQGVAKQILSHIAQQPWSQRLRRTMLGTRDAHSLYRQFDFKELKVPANIMEISRPDIYR
ncbi:GNAT family N-acetyltransferase [Flavihumibacter petaseus]|uniref:Putative acetyltransferase n=1 Tax=Flavihumibacter petaseus NBRC 106054 TaxID=1220578 RepID=A0A0E9N6C5_9BACT|nr:GNAT family N-acetyltransferase [Flavihumibacter petaseus]GAO45492.1 putative acetyltransferase [Flavihumibacter petaseus NBRC 106054]